jgi:hypothetical protein
MRQPRHALRFAAVLAGLVASGAGLLLGAGPAAAATTAQQVAAAQAGSGSWGAEAAALGSTPTPGNPYVINWNLTGTLVYNYFQIANTGTLDLTAQTYSAVNSKPTNGNAPPTIALDACVGATWNTLTGTCAGSVVRITATNQSSTAATITIPAGSALSMRALPITLPNFPQPYTTTVAVSVTRAQARPAATTNS